MNNMMRLAVRCLLSAVLLIGCKKEQQSAPPVGNAERGRQLVEQNGCTACHVVPGVQGPRGMVGPPLEHFASRPVIGGKVPNTPDNVIAFLQNPQAADPMFTMPNLGITPADSKDIAAFLATLK